MSRRLIVAFACIATPAAAQDAPPATGAPAAPAAATTTAAAAPADMSDQAIGAELGVAAGGRVTAGGLRISGHYLYQLAAQDWFDGIAAFTFGGNSAACFRDRMDVYICDHAVTAGDGFEVVASVRHFIGGAAGGGNNQFWPFVRGGVGIGFARFGGDSVSGLTIPLHAGAGLRVSVSSIVAITVALDVVAGFGAFNHTLGIQPQLGASLVAGAEFKL